MRLHFHPVTSVTRTPRNSHTYLILHKGEITYTLFASFIYRQTTIGRLKRGPRGYWEPSKGAILPFSRPAGGNILSGFCLHWHAKSNGSRLKRRSPPGFDCFLIYATRTRGRISEMCSAALLVFFYQQWPYRTNRRLKGIVHPNIKMPVNTSIRQYTFLPYYDS